MEVGREEIDEKSRVPGVLWTTSPYHTQPISCPHRMLQQPAETSWNRSAVLGGWGDHMGRKSYQWSLEMYVKGPTLVPARLGGLCGLMEDSRH